MKLGSDPPEADFDSEEREFGVENDQLPQASQESDNRDVGKAACPIAPSPHPTEGHVRTSYLENSELYQRLAANAQASIFIEFGGASSLLVRYGISSLGSFRATGDASRKYLFANLRKTETIAMANLFGNNRLGTLHLLKSLKR